MEAWTLSLSKRITSYEPGFHIEQRGLLVSSRYFSLAQFSKDLINIESSRGLTQNMTRSKDFILPEYLRAVRIGTSVRGSALVSKSSSPALRNLPEPVESCEVGSSY